MRTRIKLGCIGLLALTVGCSDEALEAGDCPGTPRNVTLDPVAPFYNGLLTLEFESDNTPGSVELQHYSAALSVWEPSYGVLGQKDNGTFVVQVRPQLSKSDADNDFKVRVRSNLLGCPPSSWAESDAVSLGDPVAGTTWVGTFGPGTITAQINVSVSSGSGTANGPYRLSMTSPLKHTITFAAGGVLDETFELAFDSSTAGDLYSGCRFKLAYKGTWLATDTDDNRVAVFDRRFTSMAGSACVNPPLAELQVPPGFAISDDVLSPSGIDYSPLRESPAGRAEWQIYSLIQQAFPQILLELDDQSGPDMASISGYLNAFDARYLKQ